MACRGVHCRADDARAEIGECRAREFKNGCRVPTETLSIPTEPSALARRSGERRRRSGVAIPMVSQSERDIAVNSNVVPGFACDLIALADSDPLSCASGRHPPGPRPAVRGARSCRSPSSGTIARDRGHLPAARRSVQSSAVGGPRLDGQGSRATSWPSARFDLWQLITQLRA
jgi:hypothetical protein